MSLKDHAEALDCTVYRPDENDPDAEELELGDARILIEGPFEAPAEWDAAEREDYFDDSDPALFVTARIECEAKADSSAWFVAEPGDYVAVIRGLQVEMYYVYDLADRSYVLIRDDQLD
ncbi:MULTISPECIES: hypothetical protein [unclassified Pseudomonas]|uniref:hypothetical protein n=1 Tax=unclassified Pseudomonas TaxID=196821 RepID=UPI00244BD41B|nr:MULTISPECIES: hypothetical protein [unclassified Pseudomonas]MDG9928920.1 hypothetical protein [Pseudomonas sp. GD04042]MDH0483911.1 hypothetical protein [Pseudomonas sp. GD04015]MDH0604246.1 hypothetical protein [Pseudomonas sp. GD03869]